MTAIDRALEKARALASRIVLPEISEERMSKAARRIRAEGIAEPLELADVTPAQVAAVRSVRGAKEALVRRMLQRPLIRAAAMVAAEEADGLVAGVENPTRRVVEAASIAIGTAPSIEIPSSFFLMAIPDGSEFLFADCALNVAPDAAQLAGIATASARSAEILLGRASIAMLSFSTLTSGAGASVDRVKEATELAEKRGLSAVGPIQADAALNPEIAKIKGVGDERPNVLIFPDLDAGNIGYKLVQELAGARAIGPFLQGFNKPVCDLSRGASVDDIIAAVAVTVALGSNPASPPPSIDSE
ncbi:MAG: phosphate acyltransferase [Albidovulum sp.]|nr:phosphate acyltransferase [Albidovulum sp.]